MWRRAEDRRALPPVTGHSRSYFWLASRSLSGFIIRAVPAYLIARVEVTDWNRYRDYTKATPAAIRRFGGKFIVRGGEMVTLEGPPETHRVVIIEFSSLARAKAFYHSQEYSRVKKLREGAATGQLIAIDGYTIGTA